MPWIGFFIGTPARLAVTGVVILALTSTFWPGVVAHLLWVATGGIFSGLWWLLLELKWLLLAAGMCAAVFLILRHL